MLAAKSLLAMTGKERVMKMSICGILAGACVIGALSVGTYADETSSNGHTGEAGAAAVQGGNKGGTSSDMGHVGGSTGSTPSNNASNVSGGAGMTNEGMPTKTPSGTSADMGHVGGSTGAVGSNNATHDMDGNLGNTGIATTQPSVAEHHDAGTGAGAGDGGSIGSHKDASTGSVPANEKTASEK